MTTSQIVITGGPCAGKTTSLSTLEQRLTDKGYKVITVPESATEMILSGIQPTEIGGTPFEKLLIELQLTKEKIAREAASHYKKSVILLDRGIPDCLAYMSPEDYVQTLSQYHLTPNDACNRYDAVCHLVTAAVGAESFYTCANNPTRLESDLDVARLTDQRTQQAYVGHPHLRIIDNSTDFQNKVNRLCTEVFAVLGIPVPFEIERKFLINRPTDDFLKSLGAVPQKVVQAYLQPIGNVERRIRERGDHTGFTCFYTEKEKLSATRRIERERKISEREYMALLTEAKYILTKTRWCFLHEGQYFEMDTFDTVPDKALLEIELTEENQKIILPKWCTDARDVTDDEAYRNHAIAKNGFPK